MYDPRRAFAEEMPLGHSVRAFILVTEALDIGNEAQPRLKWLNADHDVQNRLRRDAADRGAADVFDGDDRWTANLKQALFFLLKQVVPFLTVGRKQNDASL